jgi:sulfite reductase (NADPH) hemoprotein beta-component
VIKSPSSIARPPSPLNEKLYAEDLDHAGIIAKLDPLFAAYAARRKPGERFGGFVIRAGFVAPTTNGADFHANTGAQRAA